MKATFLSRFTPSTMTPEALEGIFVQREDLAQRLVALIRESALTQAKQYTLLIGPRGIGKTHLVSLIYHRVKRMDDLRDRLLFAWLREDEWGITSFLDLLLRIFRALLAEYDEPALAQRVEALYNLPPQEAERAGAALLKEFVGERTLLIFMENLDDVFQGLGDKGQKQLRAYLQENPFCTIVATSQSLFNGVKLQTSPFYGFFRINHLQGLSFEDATRLLTNIACYEGDAEGKALASFIQTPTGRARIRAVHHLAGNNPRVYVVFAQFLTQASLDELVEPLMRTFDDLTPYYQARMAWLSPQQRKIVELLCDCRHAVPVKELAQRCFMTHQTASSQLVALREMGYVQSTAVGRESYYDVHEPLMRLCMEVKKQRGEPVRLLVDFLRLWYSPTELRQRLEMLPSDATFDREYMLRALQEAEGETEDPRVAACLQDYKTYYEASDFVKALKVAEDLLEIRGHARDYVSKGCCLFSVRQYVAALETFDQAIDLDSGNALIWYDRGAVFGTLGLFDEALISFDRAIELDSNRMMAWFGRGLALSDLGHHREALASLDTALDLDPSQPTAWYCRGVALNAVGRHGEALVSYDRSLDLDRGYLRTWVNRGATLFLLGRVDEALVSANKALELDPSDEAALRNQTTALFTMGRYDEALASCDKAIESGVLSPFFYFSRVECLLALDRWDGGSAALDNALHHFAHVDEPYMGDTTAIVRDLFSSTRDVAVWRTRVATLIEVYEQHQVVSELGQGLVRSIPALMLPMVGDEATRQWRVVWQELASRYAELQLPLRLLDAAVRYRETHDERALLALAVEERDLLRQVLEQSETSTVERTESPRS